MTGAAFYDLDKTIIAKSSTLAFRRPFAMAGLIDAKDSLLGAAAQGYYRISGASGDQLDESKARMGEMIRGWPVEKVESLVAGTVEQIIAPYVYVEALSSIRWHKEQGRQVVVISSSPQEWVEPIGYMVGADRVIATQLSVKGGKYTGDVLFYAYGEQKAIALKALAEAEGIDLEDSWAYTDSYTDLPMLEAVGNPVPVNPDPELREAAQERGWETVNYVRPPSWDSPFSFVWDAANALPDVPTSARIGVTGWYQLIRGSVVAWRDALVALTMMVGGSEEEHPFFPSVQRREIRGLRTVTEADVRKAYEGHHVRESVEAAIVAGQQAGQQSSDLMSDAVQVAEDAVAATTADVGERVAKAAEAAADVVRSATATPQQESAAPSSEEGSEEDSNDTSS